MPRISQVLEINCGNETNNDIVRNKIYEYERSGYGFKALATFEAYDGETLVNSFRPSNSSTYQESKAEWRIQQSRRTSNEANRNYPNGKKRGYNFEESDEGSGRDGESSELNNKSTKQYSLEADIERANRIKTFTKRDAEEVFDDLAFEVLQKHGIKITGKGITTQEIATLLNTQNTRGSEAAIKAAAGLIVNRSVIDDLELEAEQLRLGNVVSVIRREIMKKYDLSEIREELEYRYSKTGAKGILLAWSNKSGKGIDTIADIRDNLIANGIDIGESTNAADIFSKVKEIYDDAKTRLIRSLKVSVTDYLGKEEYAQFKRRIEQHLNEGRKKGLESEIKNLKRLVRDTEKIWSIKLRLKDVITSIKEYSKRNPMGDSALTEKEFTYLLKVMPKSFLRNKVHIPNLIGVLNILKDVYTEERLGKNFQSFVANNISDMCASVKVNMPLNVRQMQKLKDVYSAIASLYKNVDRVFFENKMQNIEAVSEKLNAEQLLLPKIKNGVKTNALRFMLKNTCDPRSYFRFVSGYEGDSVLMTLFEDVQKGEIGMIKMNADLLKERDKFFKKTKGYSTRLNNDAILVNVVNKQSGDREKIKLPIDTAVGIYLTSLREQAKLALYGEAGVLFKPKNGDMEYQISESEVIEMSKKFTEEDKQYIQIIIKFNNDDCSALIAAADIKYHGCTNITDSYYYSMSRAETAYTKEITDFNSYRNDVNMGINNLSMNKKLAPNAKSPLRIRNTIEVMNEHARQVSMYVNLFEPLNNYDKIMNKNVGNNSARPMSPRAIIQRRLNDGGKFENYVATLLGNIQGNKGVRNKLVSALRSSYAKFQIGFNMKSILSQFASFPMSGVYLSAKNMVKALKANIDKEIIYKFSPFIKGRADDMSAVRAMGLIDKIGNKTNMFMKPMGVVDDFICCKVFVAACYEAAEKENVELFSDENFVLAAKLSEKVIRETQANYLESEKTGMMRSDSDFVLSFAMFGADGTKQASRIIDATGALLYAAKSGDKNKVSKAKRQLVKSLSSVAGSILTVTVLGVALNEMLGRGDDEKEFLTKLFEDFASNTVGMIPVFRDFYSYFMNGFETDNFLDDTINNMLGAINSSIKTLDDIEKGEIVSTEDIFRPLLKFLYAGGQLVGVPTRNIVRTIEDVVNKYVVPKTKGGDINYFDFESSPLDFKESKLDFSDELLDFENPPFSFKDKKKANKTNKE